ncbi:sensory transduction histidine kinase [Methanosarcina acetivorans C2A]|uniref:Sensory transduction histidine kinase n=2 Tax=Methanosarcina acetivorans TaxID=2214 RepID=Q8TSN7_METAC|nr:sensory transduction histidine kinase [Methanosarcina acetivorans C2A]
MEILIPYFKSGLENNELCVWIISKPLEVGGAKEALRTTIPDIDVYLAKGQIEIVPQTQGHVNEGIFDSEQVINGWVNKLDRVLSRGYEGLRVAGATSWLKKEDWDDFVAYEKKADSSIRKRPIISLCPYFLEMCSAADIIDVTFNHQFALIKREGKWERIDNSGWENLSGKKQAEEAIPLEEPRPGLNLENIFSPSQEMANLELADIIDIGAVQSLMNDFYEFSHVTIGLVDLKGNVLVWVGWQDICTRFHRVHPEACKHCIESDTKLSAGVAPGEFKLYRCKNNMWDVATPIVVGGQHVGNIFSGQFFFEDEPLDYELFRAQARKYGFNEEEYIAALEKVPRLSRGYVDTVMSFFMKFAHMISQLSYTNVRLAQSLTERESLVDALRESEKCERARSDEMAVLLDAVPTAVWIAHDSRALHITGNRLSYEWLRIPLGSNASKSSPPGERPETFKVFRNGVELSPVDLPLHVSAAGTELLDYEFDFVYPDGVIRHVLGNARPLHDEIGNPRGSVAAFIDITERKRAEEALQKAYDNLEEKVKERTAELEEACKALVENERRLSEAQKMAHIGIWDWDLVTDEMYWSDEAFRIAGCSPRKSGLSYTDILNLIHPDDREYVDNTVKRALKGKPFGIDPRIVLADGENRVVHVQGEVVFDEKNNPLRMRGAVQDITESKRAEEKIKILADAVESSDDAIITKSLDGIITSWNKGAEQIYGYLAEEILGKNASILEPFHLKGDMKQLTEKIKRKEKIQRHRTLGLKKDGTIINVSITLSPIFDASGEPVAVSAIARDITERIRAEEALAKIEDARKKEIHHRIKNNLQVISSLLDLQAEKFRDKDVLEAFRESQSRVLSMSLIHEELYKGGETDTLDFSTYLEKLAENLFRTYSFRSKNICLSMNLEENAFFNMDIAVPLGIIVNELVSNSLKHAFTEKEGDIRIRLCREESDCEMSKSLFSLTISDNGKGIPENVELESVESLGLQLVNILVDQLDGNIKLKHDQGTECRIEFKVMERS